MKYLSKELLILFKKLKFRTEIIRCLSGFVPGDDSSHLPPTRGESTYHLGVSIVEDQVLEIANTTRLILWQNDEELATVG